MNSQIIELLSDTQPMTGPEILIHFPLCQRKQRVSELERLVEKGEVEHIPVTEQQVRVAAFKLPEGSHVQRCFFDLEELG